MATTEIRATAVASAQGGPVVTRRSERSPVRRGLTLASVVTFVLLVTCALVSFSPSHGFRTPGAGATGLHHSARPSAIVVSARSGCSAPTAGTGPAPATCNALIAHNGAIHAGSSNSDAAKTTAATRHLVGSSAVTPSRHDTSPTNGTTKNGSSAVHIVFTQAGAERWDALTSTNFHKDLAGTSADRLLRDLHAEQSSNTSSTVFDDDVRILSSNLSAAKTHQFASSL
jgi:hypothetical protein